MIEGYAREPGVRGLENHIKRALRKSVKSIVESKGRKKITIDVKDVPRLLGRRIFFDDLPSHIRKGLQPHFVATFADVVGCCFGRGKKAQGVSNSK